MKKTLIRLTATLPKDYFDTNHFIYTKIAKIVYESNLEFCMYKLWYTVAHKVNLNIHILDKPGAINYIIYPYLLMKLTNRTLY